MLATGVAVLAYAFGTLLSPSSLVSKTTSIHTSNTGVQRE